MEKYVPENWSPHIHTSQTKKRRKRSVLAMKMGSNVNTNAREMLYTYSSSIVTNNNFISVRVHSCFVPRQFNMDATNFLLPNHVTDLARPLLQPRYGELHPHEVLPTRRVARRMRGERE